MTENDSSLFNVDIENYNGPLDILLDLAKSQKVNLENISIAKLADQFHDFITNQKNLNLESASEYLLMATWLAYLKSKLLLPGTPEEEFKVQEVAEKLKLQLKKLDYLLKNDFLPFKRKNSFFAMTAHIIFKKIDLKNTVTHSKKMVKLIRNKIGFKNILISDDISMKSLKGKIKENTINAFNAGCDLVLHCNAKENEMEIVAQNSPFISKFVIKKTSQFYKIIS